MRRYMARRTSGTTFAMRKRTGRNAGVGIAARHVQLPSFKGFVRTGTVRPAASIARALRLSAAHSQRIRAVMTIGCR